MKQRCYPDYDNSSLSLISSILRHYGAGTLHKTLPALDALLQKKPKNVVLMLFDGLGSEFLAQHKSEAPFLFAHQRETLSAVFPSTTTAATVSIESGLSPLEHAWLGWTLYFKELDANVDIFPNTAAGKPAADYHVARRYLPYEDVFSRITNASGGKVEAHCFSQFTSYPADVCRSTEEICAAIRNSCAAPGEKYLYSYWQYPDYTMHEFGTSHEEVLVQLRQIDAAVRSLCETLTDTLVLVTADHGLVDVQWEYLSDYPDLTDCLLRAPSMEARAMNFFVKDGMRERFAALFEAAFGANYLLFTHEEALQKGLFGGGTAHERVAGFLGDFLAVATDEISIDSGKKSTHPFFKAAHAGFSKQEMRVPMIVVET